MFKSELKELNLKLYETEDYSIFDYLDGNRPVILSGPSAKNLRLNLKKYGWLKSRPAITCKSGDKYLVIDGQHKIAFAQQLKTSVVFAVLDISIDNAKQLMIDLQYGKNWVIENYVNKHVNDGNSDMVFLKNYATKNNISVSCAANMLYGQLPSSNNVSEYIKDGSYKVKNIEFADRCISIFKLFKGFDEICCHRNLLTACAKVALVKEFDINRFEKKIFKNQSLVKNEHSSDNFMEMIEDIYNRNSSDKLNIKFLAQEEVRRRNFAGGLNK